MVYSLGVVYVCVVSINMATGGGYRNCSVCFKRIKHRKAEEKDFVMFRLVNKNTQYIDIPKNE